MNALICILSLGLGGFGYEATLGDGDWLDAGKILFHQAAAVLLYVWIWEKP